MIYLTEPLNVAHNRVDFSCGKPMLDNYLQKQANQDSKRKLAACFVLNDSNVNLIKGYYTLSNNSIPQTWIPDSFRKKLPQSYQQIPVTLLGRLAIDSRYQGMNIGRLLLIDALKRSYNATKTIGSFAVVADPLDPEAKNFYLKYGFTELPDSGKVFLSMNTVRVLFGDLI